MVSVSSRFSNTFVMRSALNICVTEFWFPASEPTWWNKHTSRCHPWTWMSCMCVCVCNGISLSFHFSIQFSLITTNNACFPFLVVSLLPISTYLYRLPQTHVCWLFTKCSQRKEYLFQSHSCLPVTGRKTTRATGKEKVVSTDMRGRKTEARGGGRVRRDRTGRTSRHSLFILLRTNYTITTELSSRPLQKKRTNVVSFSSLFFLSNGR